ncbi:MAG: hypothetical protein IKT67_01030 [Lachnospiraceae bacterium]|nr:hypothetical protein [Lachnospiraceae bacterium]
MKRIVLFGLMVLGLVAFAGCSKDKPGETTKAVTAGKTENQFVPEDYEPGNRTKYLSPMMKTDKGLYYYSFADKGIHYYDLATQKTMFLCNKPECRHGGSEFCVATNGKYLTLSQCKYNDVILAFVLEETDTQYLFKVLSIALDGSEMDEVATVLELDKTTDDFSIYQCFMYAHRNKVFLTFTGSGQVETEYHGTAVLDLNTKKTTFLDEEPFSKDNVAVSDVSGYGDYFYYCKKEGKKLLLHRYHIENGTDESFRLLTNFSGQYVLLDEDTIAYIRSAGTVICTHQISTGHNTEHTKIMRYAYWYKWQEKTFIRYDEKSESEVVQLLTDGTYVYAPEIYREYRDTDENGEEIVVRREGYIHVYNQALEEIALVNMAEAAASLGFDDMEWSEKSYTQMLHYLGEEIYWKLIPKGTTDSEKYVFRCNRSDFIAGKPKFEYVYQYSGY